MGYTNLFDRDISAELLLKTIEQIRENQKEKQDDFYDTVEDYYNNTCAEEDSAAKYFPKLGKETDDEYKARIKCSIPWAKIFINSIVHWFYQGNTRYEWVPKILPEEGQSPDNNQDALAEQANAIMSDIFERNEYKKNRIVDLEDALVYGRKLRRPEYHRYNMATGLPYEFNDVMEKGTVMWSGIKDYHFLPIYHPRQHDLLQAVIICYDFDNERDKYGIASYNLPANTTYKRIVELISGTVYNPLSGAIESTGKWKAYEVDTNGHTKEILGYDGKSTEINRYGIMPCVLFENWQGRSIVYDARELLNKYNLEITAMANIMHYVGYPIFQFLGPKPAGHESLAMGPNRIIYTGTSENKMESINPAYNEGPFLTMLERYERFLSFAFSVPLEVINGLKESKSGIQLKMLFTSMVHLRENLQQVISVAERDYMFKSLYILETENGIGHKYTDILNPVVTYEENIIPSDEAQDIVNDMLKLSKGIVELPDLILKYNSKIKTIEEAQELIDRNKTTMQAGDVTAKDNLKQELFGRKEEKMSGEMMDEE